MEDTEVSIRSFQTSDLLKCHEIIRNVYLNYGHIDDYAEKAVASDMADIEKNYMHVEGGHWWVAISKDQEIIGQIAMLPLSSGDRKCYQDVLAKPPRFTFVSPEKICELRRLAVSPRHQNCGVGSKLLQTFLKHARERTGYKAIHLTTLTSMISACQFYEKYGFKRGKVEKYNLNFDSDKKVFYTKSAVFEDISELSEEERCKLSLPMYESYAIYVQHFWMTLD